MLLREFRGVPGGFLGVLGVPESSGMLSGEFWGVLVVPEGFWELLEALGCYVGSSWGFLGLLGLLGTFSPRLRKGPLASSIS